MLITHLELENFKSYSSAQISFRPGTNAIIGANGAGKSSLLEAIGFALFNHCEEGMNQADLLHEGSVAGRVVVRMNSSHDGRDYDVERCFTIRGTTRYCVYDVELGQRLVDGAREAQDWLREHLCIESEIALSALFRNTVGVPQGSFTAPFLEAAAVRKGIFDPLLQVGSYKKASDQLAETSRHLEKQRSEIREQIAWMEGQTARLPAMRGEQESLEQEIAELKQRLSAWQTDLQSLLAELQQLDAAEKSLRELAQAVERARTELAAQQALWAGAQRQCQEAEEAQERARASQGGHEVYLEAEERLATLEGQRLNRDRLRQAQSELQAKHAALAARSERLAVELAEIAAVAQCLEALAPLVEKQSELEAALKRAEGQVHDLAAARRREGDAQAEVLQARAVLERQQRGVQQAAGLEQAVAQTQTRLAALAEDEKKMREKRAEALAEAQRLEKQSGALAESATARCPVCESELTSEHRDELLARNAQRSQELRAQGQVLDNGLTGCADEAGALRAALARDQQQLRSLPTQASLQQAEEALTLRAGAWERVQAEVTALRDAPVRHEALQQALAALNDPRHEYQRGEDQVRQRPAKEHESQQVGARDRELAGSMAAVEGELATYEGLDEAVRAMQTLRNQHREAHNTFIANHNAAQQLAARQGQVERLSAEVRAHSERLDAANAQHTQAMGGYDATRHDLVHQQVNSRQQEVAGGSAQEQEKHRRLDAVRQELEHLTTLRHELQCKQAQEQSLRELYALVEMIRDLLRRAGPYITRHLVRQISWDASNFYSDIIGDPSAQLQWSEDYELWLEVKGLKRTFRQLSGGEQMAAALALRLALLRLNSGVDVAFFDEPTAHLDPERRDGLAEKIMQVKGFSQLFVISHDDTFERAAQSYVRIVKDEAGSHAEEG